MRRRLAVLALAASLVAGCSAAGSASSAGPGDDNARADMPGMRMSDGPTAGTGAAITTPGRPLPGMPPLLKPNDVYAADRPNAMSPAVAHDRPLIYVPNSDSNTVSVINPKTHRVIATHPVGALPQHVVPSWHLKTLYVLND